MLDRSARKTSCTAGWRLAMLVSAGILIVCSGLAAASDQRLTPIVRAAQKAKPSVVSIRGEKTVLPGIGSLSCVDKKARTGRNPRTGAEIEIPAKKTARFSVSTALAAALNSTGRAKIDEDSTGKSMEQ